MTLKDRIAGAEISAATEKSPIAALFDNHQGMMATPSTGEIHSSEQNPQFLDLPVGILDEMEQPFRLYSDKKMEQMRDSIIAHGIIQRLIVRPNPEKPGRYQIISGRNRRRGAIMAGYTMVPCEIRELDDDEARLLMVACNLEQREELSLYEKTWAYRIRLEALAHQGKRTSGQIDPKLRSNEVLAKESDESVSTIQRYIRLTYLLPELFNTVDNGNLGFGAGVTLSYLSTESQAVVYQYFFVDHKQKIGGDLADALRFAGEKGPITEELISRLLSPAVKAKPKPLRKVAVNMKPIRSFFPDEATPKEIEKKIIEILTEYFNKEEG